MEIYFCIYNILYIIISERKSYSKYTECIHLNDRSTDGGGGGAGLQSESSNMASESEVVESCRSPGLGSGGEKGRTRNKLPPPSLKKIRGRVFGTQLRRPGSGPYLGSCGRTCLVGGQGLFGNLNPSTPRKIRWRA